MSWADIARKQATTPVVQERTITIGAIKMGATSYTPTINQAPEKKPVKIEVHKTLSTAEIAVKNRLNAQFRDRLGEYISYNNGYVRIGEVLEKLNAPTMKQQATVTAAQIRTVVSFARQNGELMFAFHPKDSQRICRVLIDRS